MGTSYPTTTRHGRSLVSEKEGHPVIAGLVALVSVGVVVGILVSGGALAASSLFGLDGSDEGGTTSSQQSMYLPRPSTTESPTGPLVTLQPGATTPGATDSTAPATPEFEISSPRPRPRSARWRRST